jgi:nicotinate phosphoribosyltransferase
MDVMESALATDLYELTMAVSYYRHDMTGPATFSLFARHLPPQRGFLVCAGLSDCLRYLESFRFTAGEIAYVADELGLSDADQNRLRVLRFSGDVWAIPESRVVTTGEPLIEVTAPAAEAQLVETALLNFITFQTSVATKAARCRIAAPRAQLVDFSLRRTQSLQAGREVARASAIAGFDASSNVAAARAFGLAASGTMAHSYVEAFPSETDAFRTFAKDFPGRTTFLVDTYDTLDGVRHAIEVINELALEGAVSIRLDSGDLARLAKHSRALLDAAGLPQVRIIASGGLDEYALDELTRSQAPIDAFGVGTKVGVSADAPYLDTAYKLVEFAGRPVFKLSAGKATMPGRKQVFRGGDGRPDQIGLRGQAPPPATLPLLRCFMSGGRLTEPQEPLLGARQRCVVDLAQLEEPHRRLRDPVPLTAVCTPELLSFAREAGALVDGPRPRPGASPEAGPPTSGPQG